MISSIMKQFWQLFNPLVEVIFRIYKPNVIIVFDPLFSMIGFIILSESWTDVVEMSVIFFFNQL